MAAQISVAVLVAAAALLNPSAERHRQQIQASVAERSPLAGVLGVGALLMAGIGAAVVMVRRRKSAHDDTDAALMPRRAA